VKIHAIKEKDLPAIDDEFAKDVSEFDSLEELKGNIKSMLEETAKNKAEHELRNSVLGKVVASVELQLPNAVVEKQIDQMLKDFEYRLRSQGINLEYYYQMTGGNEEDLRNQIRVDAAERVKTQVVLDKISELEKVEAAEAEVQQEIEKIAAQYKMEAEKFRSNLREQELNYVKDSIITRKTIDLLVESAIIS
jgi:trigger factor